MACMEHSCLSCGNFWMDNLVCPFCQRCGSMRVTNQFAEYPDPPESDEYDD